MAPNKSAKIARLFRRFRSIAIMYDLDFIQGDKAPAHHLVEHGQKRPHLFLCVDDLDDERQIHGSE